MDKNVFLFNCFSGGCVCGRQSPKKGLMHQASSQPFLQFPYPVPERYCLLEVEFLCRCIHPCGKLYYDIWYSRFLGCVLHPLCRLPSLSQALLSAAALSHVSCCILSVWPSGRSVSAFAFLIESVRWSAYNITFESMFLAALPVVCIMLRSSRRNPSLSASSIPISPTSGMSRPSLSRFIPTSASYLPRRSSLIISVRSRCLSRNGSTLFLSPPVTGIQKALLQAAL